MSAILNHETFAIDDSGDDHYVNCIDNDSINDNNNNNNTNNNKKDSNCHVTMVIIMLLITPSILLLFLLLITGARIILTMCSIYPNI